MNHGKREHIYLTDSHSGVVRMDPDGPLRSYNKPLFTRMERVRKFIGRQSDLRDAFRRAPWLLRPPSCESALI
jgi:hypothetical protein